jgi:hypothetical protein
MNICVQFCFHIGLLTRWQQVIYPTNVYGFHPLMPTEYVLPTINGDHRGAEPTKVLTAKIIELEKLQKNGLEA